MDKILLTIFLSVLAGFFTAALSIVKLVNDKENKTTDYRQAWTESLRKCFADLISNINSLATSVSVRMHAGNQAAELVGQKIKREKNEEKSSASIEGMQQFVEKQLHDENSHIRELRRDLYHSYALTKLHFKPNDLSFSRIEQKFDVIMEMFEKLTSLQLSKDEPERKVLKEKIRAAASEITGFSRDILKTEWESVKKGEGAYQKTKAWSLIGGAISLFIILIFGVGTAWTILKGSTKSNVENSEKIGVLKIERQAAEVLHVEKRNDVPNSSQVVTVLVEPNCASNGKTATKSSLKPSNNVCDREVLQNK